MASVYEFEGKTKDEAIDRACKELGLEERQLRIEVLSYGSTGIFGLVGVKKARIKVTVPDSKPVEQKEERKPKEREPIKEKEGLREKERPRAKGKPRAKERPKERKPEPEEATAAEPAPAPPEPMTPEEREELAGIVKASLEKIVSFMADDTTVTVETEESGIRAKIGGENTAILIGKHGKTLYALQYLIQRIVQKHGRAKARITVDVADYRDRRKDSLTQLALRLGEKVKRSGKPQTISPMNPQDRRIIHIALRNDARVRTQSMGTGPFRKVVIYPQRKQKKEPMES